MFLLVFVYLMCGPGQLFFFQRGPEMPKGWTPLGGACWCPTRQREPHFILVAVVGGQMCLCAIFVVFPCLLSCFLD